MQGTTIQNFESEVKYFQRPVVLMEAAAHYVCPCVHYDADVNED